MKKSNLKYYSPKEILSKKDLDGLKPTIYMVTSNRSGGKTTSLLIRALELFKEKKRKTILLYRNKYELGACYTIFKTVLDLYPKLAHDIKQQSRAGGLFYELYDDDGEHMTSIGFCMALSNVDSLKKYSPFFSDVDLVIFDEFQKEDGRYLKNEVKKLQSILVSIARGGGSQARELEVFLLGNDISMLNPYFIFFDVNRRYKEGAHFIRGNGWIAEFVNIESATKAIQKSGLYRAFQKDTYIRSATGEGTLYKEKAFLEKMSSGKGKYLFTIIHDGKYYGVREEEHTQKLYISQKYDKSCKYTYAYNTGDHGTNTVLWNKSLYIHYKLKNAFDYSLMRFDSLEAKNVIYDILALDFTV